MVFKEFYLLLFIRDSEAEGGVTFSAGNLAISRSQRWGYYRKEPDENWDMWFRKNFLSIFWVQDNLTYSGYVIIEALFSLIGMEG